jgi:biopolymer transport protein ExbB
MKKKIIFTFLLIASPLLSFAQDAEAGIEVAKKVTPEKITALDFVMKGGVFIIPIILLLFYTIYVIVQRYRYIKRMTTYSSNLLTEVKGVYVQPSNPNDMSDDFVKNSILVAQRDQTSFGVVVVEGLKYGTRPVPEIESRMERMVNIEIGKMEKGLGHLGLIAGIAPTFGFIGTIAGVIKIFYNISISENVSIGNISGGLYEKMISSGAGLVVGIFAYSADHLLNGMIDNYTLKVQSVMQDVLNILRPSKWQ